MDPAVQAQLEIGRLSDGFIESSVLCALATLGVFELVGEGAASAADLAERLRADASSLARLLAAAVALGILDRDDGDRVAVPPRLQPALVDERRTGYLGNWLRYLNQCQRETAELAAFVRDPELRRVPRGPWRDAASLRNSTWAMHDYAALRGRELAERLDWSGSRSLLDVGCGPGTYALQIAEREPRMRICFVDVAEVLEITREVAARFALPNPVEYEARDLSRESVAGEFDVVIVSNVLMALGVDASRDLLRRLHDNVAPGGRIVVQAPFLSAAGGRSSRWPAVVDLLLLCTTAEGRNHGREETREWLDEAGFEGIEAIPQGLLSASGLLVARRSPK